MTDLLRQGLETTLSLLEERRLELLGESIEDGDAPLVCADCYTEEGECRCPSPILWPLPAVVYKLRAELALR